MTKSFEQHTTSRNRFPRVGRLLAWMGKPLDFVSQGVTGTSEQLIHARAKIAELGGRKSGGKDADLGVNSDSGSIARHEHVDGSCTDLRTVLFVGDRVYAVTDDISDTGGGCRRIVELPYGTQRRTAGDERDSRPVRVVDSVDLAHLNKGVLQEDGKLRGWHDVRLDAGEGQEPVELWVTSDGVYAHSAAGQPIDVLDKRLIETALSRGNRVPKDIEEIYYDLSSHTSKWVTELTSQVS